MQLRAKQLVKKITAKPIGVYVDYEAIQAETISNIPEPIQGERGEDGLQGPQGDQGLIGDIGIQGEEGSRGLTGDQGLLGLQGLIGQEGKQGKKGSQGDKGTQGLRGTQGAQGKTGAVSAKQLQQQILRALSTDSTLADFTIDKKGNVLIITKLYKDGRITTDRIRMPGGGGSGSSAAVTDFGVHKRYINEEIIIQDNCTMINRPLCISSSSGGSIEIQAGGEILIVKDGLT